MFNNLTQIIVPETVLTINATAFYGIPSTAKIYVYEIKYEDYIIDPNWAAYLSMLEVIATVNDFTQDGINYKVTGSDKKQVHIVGYESSVAADIELPLTVKYENKIYTLTGIDENAFKDCAKLASITFTDNINEIGAGAFSGCTCLTTITIPKNVCKIGESALLGSILQEIQYEGDNWDNIELGGGNEELSELVTYVSKKVGMQDIAGTILLQGMCGEQIEYMLISDGTLLLIGEGRTYNYHSKKTAPWYEMRDIITNVVIGEGIEQIGEQLFRGCTNLSQVTLPQSLLVIGKNAFISCVNLDIITIPCNVIEIKESAFAGVRELSVIYVGTEESWNQILIGNNNGSVYSDLCFA